MNRLLSLASLCIALGLAGCASAPEEPPTAAELYAEASRLATSADYEKASETYEALKSTYPTSPYAQQAVLEQIFWHLRRREHALAIVSADEFIRLYPDHPQTPYAMYMKGVIYFRQDRGFLDKIGRQDPTKRDPQLMRLSYEAFNTLVETYPDSKYAADAADRMRYLVNGLARGEVGIAQYYYARGAYPAALARARAVLQTYPDSAATKDALLVMMRAYHGMGASEAAAEVRQMLQLNFPDSLAEEQ